MGNKPSDRNLLFGILALQMEFITRDQLVAAMHAWVLNKAQPLGQILIMQQALRTELAVALDVIVERHLEVHGQDAQKSMASLPAAPQTVQALEQIGDGEIQRSLAHWSREPDPETTRPHVNVGEGTTAGARYRVLRPHAKGGLGEISVALDQELNREVALKEIQLRHADEPASRTRFVLEAEITGGLEHPGIVPVYGLGAYPDGRPFYAMRFVRGDSLKEAIARFHGRRPYFAGLEFRKLLGRFLDVCNALAYAHSRGVLHRDIKPDNIMLGPYGETLIVDWGLAKVLGKKVEDATLEGLAEQTLKPSSGSNVHETQAGSAVGTPQYMPPEQALGRLDLLGPASDVYSLGATLYCLLTGKPPFEQQELGELLAKVVRGEFVPPKGRVAEIPAALEAICLMAIATKPADRYSSPKALAEDLERWLADEPVKVWAEPALTRSWRWLRRHRAVVSGAVAAAFVGLVGLLTISIVLAYRNQQLNHERQTTNTALEAAEDSLAASKMMLARIRIEENNIGLAEDLLEQAQPRSRTSAWGVLKNYAAGSLVTLYGHTNTVTDVTYSPDGQTLASTGHDGTVRIWDAFSGQELRAFKGHALCYSPDGQVLAIADSNKLVRLWHAGTGQEKIVLNGHTTRINGLCFSPDGQTLASASADKMIRLWDVKSGQMLRALKGHENQATAVAFNPDGQTLASSSSDNTVRLWDAKSGRELHVLQGHADQATSVNYSPDGHTLASASWDQTVRLWSTKDCKLLRVFQGHTKVVMSVRFSPDGHTLASASGDHTVRLWQVDSGQELHVFKGHTGYVESLSYSPDGQFLASASSDWTVKLWNARGGSELRVFRGTPETKGTIADYNRSVSFSPNGQILASTNGDATVRLRDIKSGQELQVLQGNAGKVQNVCFDPGGQCLASASLGNTNTLCIWDLGNGKVIHLLQGHSQGATRVAYSPDGKTLASAGLDQTVRLWDAKTGASLHVFKASISIFTGVCFSPNGETVASSGTDGMVRLWATRSGLEMYPIAALSNYATAVSFNHDGRTLAWAGTDGTVRLCDLISGKGMRSLKGDSLAVYSISYSGDGQTLASAGNEGAVRLWDAKTLQELRGFKGQDQKVVGLSYNPDSQLLASAGLDGTVRLWNVKSTQELRVFSGQTSNVYKVHFSPDGQTLASAGEHGIVSLWDARSGSRLHELRGNVFNVWWLRFSPDGQILAIAGQGKAVDVWQTKTGKLLHMLKLDGAPLIEDLGFSSDGRQIWCKDMNGKTTGWNADTGEACDGMPPDRPWSTGSSSASPDGKTVVLAAAGGYIVVAPRQASAKELAWRLFVTSPDLHWRKDQVEQLQKNNASAAAFHLGWYLAIQDYYVQGKKPSFQSGAVYAGILQNATGAALERIQTEAIKAAALEPDRWQSHALLGAAKYRGGQFAQAQESLSKALLMRGRPNNWLAGFLAMTTAKLGLLDQADAWLAKIHASADAAWEETALAALLRPEAEQVVAERRTGK